MDGVGQLFGSIIDADDSLLTLFLDNLDEHQTFWNDPKNDLETIFAKVSTLLASARTRDRGMQILIYLLPNSPQELVEEKAQFFLNVCMKLCDQRGQTHSSPQAYKILQLLIQRSLSSNEMHKLFVSHMSKLLDPVVPSMSPSVIPSTLCFLELAMQHYAGACGPSKTRIEAFLYSLVDATDQNVVKGTAKCLLLLQQIRGGGQHGTLHKKTWEEYYLRLVDTIHDLLNQIFAHTPETFDEEENLECLKLPPISAANYNATQKAQLLSVRANNLIAFLSQAIVGTYPVPKPFAPFKALNLIHRGLSVSCEGMGKNPIVENIAFGTFLPSMQHGLLGVLDGIVLVLGTNVLIFGDTVCEMFPKCLKATASNCNDAESTKKSFTRLRTKIYESIHLWCEKMRHGSGIETVNEPILEQIVRDITPYESEVTLKMGTTNKTRMSAKAKKKLQKEQHAASTLNQAHSSGSAFNENKQQRIDLGNEALCQAALSCMAAVLQSAGCFIKPVTHKLLQEKILPLCFSLVINRDPTGLYNDGKVRAALLRAFAALIINPHHHCPPPLQYASYIFNTLQTSDSCPTVRATAAELARTMELLLHPWKESLYFPADQTAIKDAMANKDKHPLAILMAKQSSQGATNGVASEAETTDATMMDSETSSNTPAKLTAPDRDLCESDGEINESLAVTEASDDSLNGGQPAATEEPIGWVEHVSLSSSENSAQKVSHSAIPGLDCTTSYNVGIIHRTDDDEKIDEPPIVSVLDSDEELILNDSQDGDDDDVVLVPAPGDQTSKKIAERNGKHSMSFGDNGEMRSSSPKQAKLAEDISINGSQKQKNIDDIVNEMVAEFVDEP